MDLEELVLQRHVRFRLKANASPENVGQRSTLLSQSVDNRSAGWRQRSLKHVAEDAQDAVELLVLSVGSLGSRRLPLNTGHHLSNDDKINDQRRRKQRILADVEQARGHRC